LEEKTAIYVLHGKNEINDRMISIIASGLASTLPQPLKPLLAYSFIESAKIAKFSVRTVDEVVSSGINLGSTIKAVAEQFGGTGGGHDIAAGAEVSIESLEKFVQAFDATISNEKAEIAKKSQKTATENP
jgi:single-stranded-DNA-specific exonuclease